jgi:hypothetical protein
MSDNQELLINPLTKRPIKANGKVHRKLIREGVLKGIIEKDENILYEYNENDDVDYLKEALNKKLPIRKKAVKGRAGSQYENKIVSRSRTPNTKEIVDYTLEKIKNHSDIDAEIEQMIMNELCFDNKKKTKPIPIKRERATKSKVKFQIKQPETETEYETEGTYESDDSDDFTNFSETE